MININLKPVVGAIGKACKTVAYVGLMVAPSIVDEHYKNKNKIVGGIGYNDAVNGILESGMWPSDKPDAIRALKHNADESYYKAVIEIANSSRIWASDKLDLIQELSED